MKRPVRRHDNTLPSLAITTADAFRMDAQRFIQRIPRKLNDVPDFAASRLGGMFAAATQLALATELYLKALHGLLGGGKNVPQTHELQVLFSLLPELLQEIITDSFVSAVKQARLREDDSATLVIASGPVRTDQRQGRREMTIQLLLERNNTAFVRWRYMHEIPPDESFAVEFDYFHLDTLCGCLRDAYMQILRQGSRE